MEMTTNLPLVPISEDHEATFFLARTKSDSVVASNTCRRQSPIRFHSETLPPSSRWMASPCCNQDKPPVLKKRALETPREGDSFLTLTGRSFHDDTCRSSPVPLVHQNKQLGLSDLLTEALKLTIFFPEALVLSPRVRLVPGRTA
mmetsp:Transcript_2001/g.4057  ORF Transcript_2001/g.4057 Transcript_2001/m.4057 type:complete len:145 (-) Transcript_2001:104-538(-)